MFEVHATYPLYVGCDDEAALQREVGAVTAARTVKKQRRLVWHVTTFDEALELRRRVQKLRMSWEVTFREH